MYIKVPGNFIRCLEYLNSNLIEKCLAFNSFKNLISSCDSVAYANIFMTHFEEKFLNQFKIFKIKNLKSDSTFQKKLCHLLHWKPFKDDEKCFLFYLKSSFRSQDI